MHRARLRSRASRFALALLSLAALAGAPTLAAAQDYVLTGVDGAKADSLLSDYSFGLQVPAGSSTPQGQPLVVSKRYASTSAGLISLLLDAPVAALGVERSSTSTRVLPASLTATEAQLTSYTLDAVLEGSTFRISERLAFAYERVRLSTTESAEPPSTITTAVAALQLESADLSTLSSTVRSNVTTLSWTATAAIDAQTRQATWSGQPLLINRRAITSGSSPFFLDLVSSGRVLESLTIAALAGNLRDKVFEIRLKNARFVSYRVVAGSGGNASETLGIAFDSLELVPFEAGKASATTALFELKS